jgi:3-oxo-5-alpha-steroid 4-dehydrogenase 1
MSRGAELFRLAYTGDVTYDTALGCAAALAIVVACVAPFVPSPYGRFADPRFGPAVSPRVGWWLMELPATVVFAGVYVGGEHRTDIVPLIFATVWSLHYLNRGWLQPFLMRPARGQPSTFSAFVVLCGWVVTSLHAYLHARFFSALGSYGPGWLTDFRFIGGIAVYYAALAANVHADAVTRGLRSLSEAEAGVRVYRIPTGGLFELISCPAYLTELVAWAGFAVATWSPAGLFILAVSAANLVPRALETHRWYRRTFKDYPPKRRALVPWVL